jgi:hypothetical protein
VLRGRAGREVDPVAAVGVDDEEVGALAVPAATRVGIQLPSGDQTGCPSNHVALPSGAAAASTLRWSEPSAFMVQID